jgi:alginate production protein
MDRAFRQTGLHSNEGRCQGRNYFHYYGELLQPELSNFQIWTVELGAPFWQSSSVEFV